MANSSRQTECGAETIEDGPRVNADTFLMRAIGTDPIHFVIDGYRYYILHEEAMVVCNFNYGNIQKNPQVAVNAIPENLTKHVINYTR